MVAGTAGQKRRRSAPSSSASKWAADSISDSHSVEVRYAPAASLRDRLIIIDGNEVWLISQSRKDIARSSPASVSRADPDLAAMKVEHCEEL
jgi:hypothetical protein